jgi:CheY-like chemotaxis protein
VIANEGMTIIVALEDDPANSTLLRRIFERRPDTVVLTETDGERGLALVQTRRPDIVFLDLHLGDSDSEALLRTIRADPNVRDIPVVMISGDVRAETKARLREAGAQEYLEKPIVVADLLALADRLLN